MRRRLIRLGKCESGAELLEFTFVLPMLLLIVAGIIDFSFLFQRYAVVTNAAREGARVAVLPGFNASNAKTRVASYLSASGLKGTGTATVSYDTVPLDASGTPKVNVATVTVSYPYNYLVLGPIARLFGGNFTTATLKASSTMRLEAASTP